MGKQFHAGDWHWWRNWLGASAQRLGRSLADPETAACLDQGQRRQWHPHARAGAAHGTNGLPDLTHQRLGDSATAVLDGSSKPLPDVQVSATGKRPFCRAEGKVLR